MCEAYIVSVENLKEMIIHFKKSERDELLKYVPMGSNYCTQIHGCDNDRTFPCSLCTKRLDKQLEKDSDSRICKDFNKLRCLYINDSYYHNTMINLEEHLQRTHPPPGHNIVVAPETFNKIYDNMMESSKPLQMLLRQKCIYDSSMRETYEYKIETHRIAKLLDHVNPLIQRWLDTIAIKGFVNNEKKGPMNPKSYESLYMSTTMTIREHVEMYLRDSEQCNHNTVYYGTRYNLLMSQSQIDLLKNAYIDDKNLMELSVRMDPVDGTNAVIEFIGPMEPIHRPITYDEIKPRNRTVERRRGECEIS